MWIICEGLNTSAKRLNTDHVVSFSYRELSTGNWQVQADTVTGGVDVKHGLASQAAAVDYINDILPGSDI